LGRLSEKSIGPEMSRKSAILGVLK
jgi:hypothetical protein